MEGDYGTADGRWASLGPYYAMFPVSFVRDTLTNYLPPGGAILDPFAGRGTSVFLGAAANGRGLGFDVSPVAWVYSKTKLAPAPRALVMRRLDELIAAAPQYKSASEAWPEFFHKCFHAGVLRFLSCARDKLLWRERSVDRTLMAFLLTYLHGRSTQALSNQMRQTKAMAPDYSIAWWEERKMDPPAINIRKFFEQRIDWRYKHGAPSYRTSNVILGDCTKKLLAVAAGGRWPKFDLLLTSPPYSGVADYDYDQWIRLWLLGREAKPSYSRLDRSGKFRSRDKYERMLAKAFAKASLLVKPGATIYVRTDAREATLDITKRVLLDAFPNRAMRQLSKPFLRETQTKLFGDHEQKPGEVDLILGASKADMRKLNMSVIKRQGSSIAGMARTRKSVQPNRDTGNFRSRGGSGFAPAALANPPL